MSEPVTADFVIHGDNSVSAELQPAKFVPRLSHISGRGGSMPYLTTKQRVLWFLSVHPDGSIMTEHIELSDQHAIFKCIVTFPRPVDDNAMLSAPYAECVFTGYGSETRADFNDYVEKAETKAVGRALANAGFGTEALEEGQPVDAPPQGNQWQAGERNPLTRERPQGAATPYQINQIHELQDRLGLDDQADLDTIDSADAQLLITRLRASVLRSPE